MSALTHDLIVVGAGPAGMAAALKAASLGLRTLLLDENNGPGGQIYRNVMNVPPRVASVLGADYLHGRRLAQRLADSTAQVQHNTLVWDVAPDLTVTALHEGVSQQWRAPQLIAATGALERASPLPGWTRPGVMNAGAAQIALKAGGLIPEGPVVLAGGGPLLLLLGCQLLDAGADLAAVVETGEADRRWKALPHLPGALAAPTYLRKGLAMILRLRRAGVPWHRAASALVAEGGPQGTEPVNALRFESKGREHRVETRMLLLHHGVIPNTQLTRLLRVQHHWDAQQLAWAADIDGWGQTTLPGFRVAGDGAGIGGALAAERAGTLAALGAAHALGRLSTTDRDHHAAAPRRALQSHLRIRPLLDTLYRPPDWICKPADETIVCRCEEVTAGRIREMARLGCQGPNQTKFFSRCGMGPCQGRVCGGVVTQILAAELGKAPEEVGAYRIRAPLKPVPLSSLAALAPAANSTSAPD